MKRIIFLVTLFFLVNSVFVTRSFGGTRHFETEENFFDGWKLQISIDEHYLAGCIQRNVLHWGFAIKRGEGANYEEKVNFHIARWYEADKKCAAVHESAYQLCYKMCVASNDPGGDDELKKFTDIMTKNILIDIGVMPPLAILFKNFVLERAAGTASAAAGFPLFMIGSPDDILRQIMFPGYHDDGKSY